MALCDDCFEDFVHPLSHELMEKNDFIKASAPSRA